MTASRFKQESGNDKERQDNKEWDGNEPVLDYATRNPVLMEVEIPNSMNSTNRRAVMGESI
jgi:hypothetical protein